ncbi:MAG: hypothetical protein H6Q14_912 [Bacteroidetes bacterium]|nr:hypothetical protein [Bacteroidota bacterium]
MEIECKKIQDGIKGIGNILLLLPLLAVLCTALIVNDDLANPTVSGKYVWFGIALPVCMLSGLLALLLKRKAVRLSPVDWLLTAFCFWGIGRTFFLTGEFSLRLSLFFMVWAFYVVCRLMFAQVVYYQKIVQIFLVAVGLFEALWGTGQLHGYFPSQHSLFPTTGSFYNSGPYGGLLSVTLPIAVYYVLNDFQIFNRRFEWKHLLRYIGWGICAITLLIIVTILPSTLSRGAWIASLCGSGWVVFCHLLPKMKNKPGNAIQKDRKRTGLIFALLVIAFVAFVSGVYHLKKDSADGRLLMWKVASGIIKEHPQGIGIGRFPYYYGEYQVRYFYDNKAVHSHEELVAGSPEYAFNEYVQIGVEHGIIPLIVFLSLSVYAVYVGFKNREHGPSGALVSLLCFAFFSYPFSLLPFPIVYAVLLALCVNSNKASSATAPKQAIIPTGFLLALFVSVLLLIHQRYPIYEAYREWKIAKMLNNSAIDDKQALNYKNNFMLLKHESSFLFEYAQCLNRLGRYQESNRILTEMKNINCDPMIDNVMGRNFQSMKQYGQAEACFRRSCLMVPSRLYPHYLLIKLYKEHRDTVKMKKTIITLLEKEPKVNSPAIKQMKEEAAEFNRRLTPRCSTAQALPSFKGRMETAK